jgi:hypothetical protein
LALLSFQSLFTETLRGDHLLALPPSLVHSEHPAPSAACSFSVSCLLFTFFCGVGVSMSRGLCWFIPGVVVGIPYAAYLLTCWACVSQLASGSVQALLFFQCNVAWRSFVWAAHSGCHSFDSSSCFFSAKCGSSISAKFLIYGAHVVCFCPLAAILDPLNKFLEKSCIITIPFTLYYLY